MPPLPPQLIPILPLLAALLTGLLADDRLPLWANQLICGLVTLLCAFVWAVLSQSLTPSFVADFLLLFTLCAALLNGPGPVALLAPLQKWLTLKLPSPFTAWMPEPTTPKAEPQPITLPDNQPPRG